VKTIAITFLVLLTILLSAQTSDFETKLVGPGIKTVHIPGGTFQMGSNEGSVDEKPVHPVTVGNFWMGETEVTIGQYVAFLNETKPNSSKLEKWIDLDKYTHIRTDGNKYYADSGWEEKPVVNVSWDGAKAFCDQYELRLPTEAEWEYAAGGPNHYLFPWGNSYDKSQGCYDENFRSGDPPTMQVRSFSPNGYGLYDMTGYVWEWCGDWYVAYPGGIRNPFRGDTCTMLRGGSCYSVAESLRCSHRVILMPYMRLLDYYGFRVAEG